MKSWIKWRNQCHASQHDCQRIESHFTPTSSSWMNVGERFFRDLSEDVIRHGSFAHVNELKEDMEAYMVQRELEPKGYSGRPKEKRF